MKQRVRDLKLQGDKLFSNRSNLMSLWQDIAENFAPERADFTTTRVLGEDFAQHLMSGYPALALRDLSDSLAGMLRPREKTWAHMRTGEEKVNEDRMARSWFDFAGDQLRALMYDPKAHFGRAVKRGDKDFMAFGQAVIYTTMRPDRSGILYRCFHLRDVAYCENAELNIDVVHRNEKIEARVLARLFGDKVSPNVKNCLRDEPYKKIKCRHIVMPADEYDSNRDGDQYDKAFPFRSIWIDCDNDTILEEIGFPANDYVIPRWVIGDPPYAYSPAVMLALPDARMLQRMALSMLEAAEKAVDPPMIAQGGEVVQGPLALEAGGVTYVDPDYEENKFGDAVRPMQIDTRGFNFGAAAMQRSEALLAQFLYLNTINLPDLPGDMTAYEMARRVEEHVRRNLPLFEPIETEYNGGICEKTFEIGMRMGRFGSAHDIPQILRNRETVWQFDSPLQAAIDRAKAGTFTEALGLTKAAGELDPTVRHHIRIGKGFRAALTGIGTPTDWMPAEDEAEQAIAAEQDQRARAEQAQQALDAVAATADVAGRAGVAAQEVQAGMAGEGAVA